jgi:oligopeptide/dipeptide ABC transporter ATP-binding protein
MTNNKLILDVKDLKLYFRTGSGLVQAVDRVSLTLQKGKSIVVVGESGSGKTSLGRAILRLLPRNVQTYEGKVLLDGLDVMTLNDERFRREVRWKRIALVPQAAMNSLNPVIKIGEQVGEPLLVHGNTSKKMEANEAAIKACQQVGLPIDFLQRYPFELSGGMRQRAAIAMSLVTKPDLVILDEPTSALDVLTQANIMNVLKRIKREIDTSFVLVTHDIATSSEIADIAAIMYAGQIVEVCNASLFYREPFHPYSKKLMASVPTLKMDKELEFIKGQPPSLIDPPKGCRFAQRCQSRFAKCSEEPPLFEVGEEHKVKCWLYN